MTVYRMHTVSWGDQNGVGSFGSKVIDSCDPPCWCWKLNPDLLEEGTAFKH